MRSPESEERVKPFFVLVMPVRAVVGWAGSRAAPAWPLYLGTWVRFPIVGASVSPERIEPGCRQFAVADGVLDILASQVVLECPGIVAVVRELEPIAKVSSIRAERLVSSGQLWKWIDTHEKELGIGRPYLDRDTPRVAPIDGEEYAALAL